MTIKRHPIKVSDLLPSDERISIEYAIVKKKLRHFVQITPGTAMSPKRARMLADWLNAAADYIESKD